MLNIFSGSVPWNKIASFTWSSRPEFQQSKIQCARAYCRVQVWGIYICLLPEALLNVPVVLILCTNDAPELPVTGAIKTVTSMAMAPIEGNDRHVMEGLCYLSTVFNKRRGRNYVNCSDCVTDRCGFIPSLCCMTWSTIFLTLSRVQGQM